MIRNLIPLCFICLFSSFLSAQTPTTGTTANAHPERNLSPADASLQQDEAEVAYFAHQLALLREAYAANNASTLVLHESAVLMALRNEINQLELKLSTQAAQAERRKSASSGQLTQAAKPEEAPVRDPLADATTPDEIRFETMQYTLAAFERHSFDPSKPQDAARDFAKLESVLKIMREALAESKVVRQ